MPFDRWTKSCVARFLRSEQGGIAAYAGIFMTLALGGAALAVDFGRLAVLRTQMQDRADAGALAGATQLDGLSGARDRAESIARNAMRQSSSMATGDGVLAVEEVFFYSGYGGGATVDGDDSDSRFIEVALAPRSVEMYFEPIFDVLKELGATEAVAARSRTVGARAVARIDSYVCRVPPLMICDLSEAMPATDLRDPANAGRMIRLKSPQQDSTAWAPGNFGLLTLPDGSNGASAIRGALAAVEPDGCYGGEVTTAPGSKTVKVQDGVNARFDLPGGDREPAPNVINYPRDEDMVDSAAILGNGNWDLDRYWLEKHGSAAPLALSGATRYQTYLYELGETFARRGRETLYPVSDPSPAGFDIVVPPGPDVPANPSHAQDPDYDGVPSQPVASNGPARRLVQVAQLQCVSDNVGGSGTYPTDGNYLEVFITEAVGNPPNAVIYGEVVRALTPTNSSQFYANVRLVE